MRTPQLPVSPTKAGFVLLLLATFLAVAGVNSGVNLLFLLAAAALSAVLVSVFTGVLAVTRVRIARRLPHEATAGEPFTTTLSVSAALPLGGRHLHLEDHLRLGRRNYRFATYATSLGPQRRALVAYRGVLPERGLCRFQRIRCSSAFPFGLVRATDSRRASEELIVYPRRGRLLRPLPSLAGFWDWTLRRAATHGHEGDEIRSVREYQPGDSPRLIHWKTSARMGKLYVREIEPERLPAAAILLDTLVPRPAGRNGLEALELAISFAATLAERIILAGGAVSLCAAGGESTDVRQAIGEAGRARVLGCLALIRPQRRPRYDEWRGRARAFAAGRAGAVIAVLLSAENAALFRQAHFPARPEAYVVTDPAFADIFRLEEAS